MQGHSKDLHYHRTSVYSLQYHLILVTKYRRGVLVGPVKSDLNQLLHSLAKQFELNIKEITIMSDHVHMLVDASPKHSISSIMKGLKGVSAKMLFSRHPELKQQLWGGHLWQPSYFVATVSDRTEEQISYYIRHQKPSKGKRK